MLENLCKNGFRNFTFTFTGIGNIKFVFDLALWKNIDVYKSMSLIVNLRKYYFNTDNTYLKS